MLSTIVAIHTTDADLRFRGRLIKSMVAISMVGLVAILLMIDPSSPKFLMIASGIIGMLCVLPFVFGFAHYGRIHIAAWLLAVPLLVAIYFSVPGVEILEKPSTMLLIIPSLIIGITINSRAAAALEIATVLIALLLLATSHIPFVRGTGLAMIYLISTLLFIWMVIHTLERGRDEARRQSTAVQQKQDLLLIREQDLQQTNQQMQQKNTELENALSLVQQLETPIIPIAHHAVIVPLVGNLSMARAEKIQQHILTHVHQQRAQHVLVDLTGVTQIDPDVTTRLGLIIQSITLLGASVMITGINSDMAMSLVERNIRLDSIWTSGNLADAIQHVFQTSGA